MDRVTRLPLHLSLDELEETNSLTGGGDRRDISGSCSRHVVLGTLLALLQPRVGELSTKQLVTVLAALAR